MSRVIVTGAAGFIGRRTLAPLAAAGFEVHAVSRRRLPSEDGVTWHVADLLDNRGQSALIRAVEPSHLLHLAWETEPGYWTARENAQWVAATKRLLDAFAEAGGRRVTIAGTCAEYDWSGDEPLGENAPLAPTSFYGGCKDAARRAAGAIAERTGLSLSWGRVFFLYGPGEGEDRLVSSVARRLIAGERAPIGDGTHLRDYTHVDDVSAAFVALLASGVTGPVNIATGHAIAVRKIAELIAEAVGRPELLDIGALPRRAGDSPAIVAKTQRLRDEVGFVPAISIEEGIEGTVSFWRQQLES